ncbi:MAG: ATP-binding protein [Capsulimonadales bacterium]|nr:ATP-binding protein [Capsulimonadales bacterium]
MSTNLFLESLREPIPAISYSVTERLRTLFPGRALLEGDDCSFNFDLFVYEGKCVAEPGDPAWTQQVLTGWQGPGQGLNAQSKSVRYAVRWEGHTLDVLLLSWPYGMHQTDSHFWILADDREIAVRFFEAVCEWGAEVRGEVLVFDGGSWSKSRDLFQAIQGARFDNLILAGTLKEEVREDLERFFAGSEEYARYGIPWKRGILLLGPPGNGKTHCVKALINHLQRPCLYVKSFKTEYGTDQDCIRNVFARARKTTPCILVLEDLDSLIDDGNRSFFLNELDGFASNHGIVTLATTNHPERLDPAIVDRPSRFDRKYHFELPGSDERIAYLRLRNDSLEADLRLTETGLREIAAETEEFSFAYLKELFVSSIMQWINTSTGERAMDAIMRGQATLLREQMSSMDLVADMVETDGEEAMMPAGLMMAMRRMAGMRRRG